MSQPDSGPLSQDVVFDLLSSPRRRFVLYYLRQVDSRVELGDLADELAAWENDTEVDNLTSQQRKRVYVSLYQTHIPKLYDAGIVNYDRENGIVELASEANQLSAYLAVDENDIPWQLYYLAIAAVSAVAFVAVWLEVWVFASVTEFAAGITIILVFGLVAVGHYLYNQYRNQEIPSDLISTER